MNSATAGVSMIPENEAVVSVISVGYSDADPERPARKPVEKLAHFF